MIRQLDGDYHCTRREGTRCGDTMNELSNEGVSPASRLTRTLTNTSQPSFHHIKTASRPSSSLQPPAVAINTPQSHIPQSPNLAPRVSPQTPTHPSSRANETKRNEEVLTCANDVDVDVGVCAGVREYGSTPAVYDAPKPKPVADPPPPLSTYVISTYTPLVCRVIQISSTIDADAANASLSTTSAESPTVVVINTDAV